MTRNQKIALGCGGAGCFGLIVVAIAACAIYFIMARNRALTASREYGEARNYNYNINSNSNSNSNSEDSNTNSENSTNSNSSAAASSLTEDDKHKLFHAATVTGDNELINRVNVKIGILNDDYTLGEKYQEFVAEHAAWGFQNLDFIREINTPDKARDYINKHFPE
jgi:hypothetical protein